MRFEVRLLGPVEVSVAEKPVPIKPPKARALLALLALHANEVVPRPRLIDELWGDDPPAAAVNLVQGYVSDLRKAFGADAVTTHGQGYALAVERGALDVARFELAATNASRLLQEERAEEALQAACEALGIWRGAPLTGLEREPFAPAATARLEELRVLATELRAEAELALARHAAAVRGLEDLVRAHPFREHPRELLMLALYRSGRQSDALALFRQTRELMLEELGLEPSPRLKDLEGRILRQDPSLEGAERRSERRAVMAAGTEFAGIGATLAAATDRDLIAVRLVEHERELVSANDELRRVREELRSLPVRTAPLLVNEPASDLVRLAAQQNADLVLLSGQDVRHPFTHGVLELAPCDVALVAGTATIGDAEIVVLFGGAANDWAALELGAWLAGALGAPLRAAGPGRAAGRLLASASLAVQRTLGIVADPLLLPFDAAAIADTAAGAGAVVLGLPDEWRSRALGPMRSAALTAAPTSFVVRGGIRPGGLAPRESFTRYTWSLAAG